ncbi:MAG: class I SAM-dependent methyltransferase [bacterium]
MDSKNPNVEVFNRDVSAHGGYQYTKVDRLSCRLATQRTTDLILETNCFAGRSVLDMGCGDGYYTLRFWDLGKPRSMVAVDGAERAIEHAEASKNGRPIRFEVGDAHRLPYPDNSFDLVLVQSILHHDDDPEDMIREAFRLAPQIVIHEPNGNNLGLKVVEKLSTYHRLHGEKSYSSRQLRLWVEAQGGRVTYQRFAGFVPMFCPDWVARATKAFEPFLERMPPLNAWGCAIMVLVAQRRETR